MCRQLKTKCFFVLFVRGGQPAPWTFPCCIGADTFIVGLYLLFFCCSQSTNDIASRSNPSFHGILQLCRCGGNYHYEVMRWEAKKKNQTKKNVTSFFSKAKFGGNLVPGAKDNYLLPSTQNEMKFNSTVDRLHLNTHWGHPIRKPKFRKIWCYYLWRHVRCQHISQDVSSEHQMDEICGGNLLVSWLSVESNVLFYFEKR